MSFVKEHVNVAWFVALVLIGCSIYSVGVDIWYYGDDFQFVFDSPASKVFYYFTHSNPFNSFYRATQSSFLAVVQALWGLSTVPVHLTQIFIHILFSYAIFLFVVRMGFSRLQALLASGFMLVSQGNVSAVLGNDTLSQVLGTFSGCIGLWLLHHSFERQAARGNVSAVVRDGYYLLGICAFGVALASKESAISFLALMVAVTIVHNYRIKGHPSLTRKLLTEIGPLVVVAALYMVVRVLVVEAQPALGAERYQFSIGLNVIKNVIMFVASALVPVSSVTTYVGLANRAYGLLAGIGLFSMVFVAFTAYGLWRSSRSRMVGLMCAFAVIAMFPMVMLNHVGELYTYNSMPFVSILVGIGLGRLLGIGDSGRLVKGVTTLLIVLLFVSHVASVETKALLMKDKGERAAALLDQIQPHLTGVPTNGTLLLVNPSSDEVEYSVFLMRGFNVFSWGTNILNQRSGREDFSVKIVDSSDLSPNEVGQNTTVLTLRGSRVEKWTGLR